MTADSDTGANFNRNAYANNNPYKFTDPDGRQSRELEYEYKQSGATPPTDVNASSFAEWVAAAVLCGFCDLNATAPAGSGALQSVVNPMEFSAAGGLARGVGALANGTTGIANPVPATMARVIPEGVSANTLGRPGAANVFVTAADDIAGMNSSQIANRLTIDPSSTGFRVLEFPTPQGVASPVFRTNQGFVGGGRTAGGAREFVVPNTPVPPNTTVRIVP